MLPGSLRKLLSNHYCFFFFLNNNPAYLVEGEGQYPEAHQEQQFKLQKTKLTIFTFYSSILYPLKRHFAKCCIYSMGFSFNLN